MTLSDIFSKLLGRGPTKCERKPNRARLTLEILEDRLVPTTYPLTNVPVLDSNPGAPVNIYLKFDGYFEKDWWKAADDGNTANDTTGTIADSNGRLTTVAVRQNIGSDGKPFSIDTYQPIFDMDGDNSTFSDEELRMIRDTWQRVADDFSLFNVNVTTARVVDISAGKGVMAAIRYASEGGVAYLGSFSDASSPRTAVASGRSAAEAATVASQEIAHVFGLNHQVFLGTPDARPIMYGFTDGPNTRRSLWARGQIDAAGTFQDDIAVLTNVLGPRPDDHVNSLTSPNPATPLEDHGYLTSKGIIGERNDVDWFGFQVTGGTYTIRVNGVENLDARFDLCDAQGNSIDQVASTLGTSKLTKTLAAGQYFLKVASSNRAYDNLGAYDVTVGLEDFSGPRVLSATVLNQPALVVPLGSVSRSFSFPPTLLVTFSEAMDLTSLTYGRVKVDGASLGTPWLVSGGSSGWTYGFDLVRQAGSYQLTVEPTATDLFGNQLDQDRDGRLGEAVDDRCVTQVSVPLASRKSIQISVEQVEAWLKGGRSPFEAPPGVNEHLRILCGETLGGFLKAKPAAVDAYFAALEAGKTPPKDGPLPAAGHQIIPGKEKGTWMLL